MARSSSSELRADLHAPPAQERPRANDHRNAPARASTTMPAGSRFSHYVARPFATLMPIAFGIAVVVAVLIGWLNRDEGHLTPESGLGYWLGIAGAASMLLLLLYPLRKRMKFMRVLGKVAFWFRLHMFLGLVGPALILFHSNFKLGSLNSNAALSAMLIVAASGIVGRYFYGKIHLGLYGRKAELKEILADADAFKRLLGDGLPVADQVIEQLNAFTKRVMSSPTGVLASFWSLPALAVRTRITRMHLLEDARRLIRAEGRRRGWSRRERRQRVAEVERLVTLHFAAVKKAATFAFFERLFALWHVLHLPMFFLLVLAAIIHVVAVHLY
jgi:hypothetical protein